MTNPSEQISDDSYRYRTSRCSDCGVTPGTEANKNGVTAIKAQLCAEIPEPFLCHANAIEKDGQLEIPDGKEVLCRGWVEMCNILNAAGHYERQKPFQREIKMKLVEAISEIEEQQKDLTEEKAIALVNKAMGL